MQLQTRLRNHATENHRGILSSNPDVSWIRTEFLLKSSNIYNSEIPYYVPPEDKNEDYATHIVPTRLNKYLPPDFYASTARGKPRFWIERYLNGSFEFSEGNVYPDFMNHVVEPFKIPDHWQRIGGADFGISDYTVLLLGAINPDDGTVYIYREYYKNVLAVPQHAKKMKEMLSEIPLGRLMHLVADPSGMRRNINDHRSLFDHYGEYGIFFREGNNRIEPGIAKVGAYFSLDKLKIFNTCVHTIREGTNYKYKTRELDSQKNADEKPVDKDNHAMDSLRYLINELPDDPKQLIQSGRKPKVYGTSGQVYDDNLPYALQEDPIKTYSSGNGWLNY